MAIKAVPPLSPIVRYTSVPYETELSHVNVTGAILWNVFNRVFKEFGSKNQSNPLLQSSPPKEKG